MADQVDPKVLRLAQAKADVQEINNALVDMAMKLSNIAKLGEAFSINDEGLDKTEKKIRAIGKILPKLGKDWEAIYKKRKSWEEKGNKLQDEFLKTQNKIRLNEKQQQESQGKKKNRKNLQELQHAHINLQATQESQRMELLKFNTELQESDTMTKALAKSIANNLLQAVDNLGKSLIALGVDSVFAGFKLVYGGLQRIYDLVNRTVRAVGEFNLSMGAATKGLAGLQKEGWEAEAALRGLSDADIGVGLKELGAATKSFGFTTKELSKFRTTAVLAGQAMGVGSEVAGELSRSFYMMGIEQGKVATSFVDIADAANDADVPVEQFGREISSVKGFMVSFGKVAKKIFLDSAVYAKKLGVSMASLEQFTKVTDSFEKSAEMAAKLNTVFGTSVNALDMMLEKNPAKRIEMIRQSLLRQGKDFDRMSRQEVEFLKTTTGFNEEELAGMLKNGLTYDKIMKKRAKQQKSEKQAQKEIQQATLLTARTLNNWSMTFDQITKAFMPILKPFTDWLGLTKDGTKDQKSFAERVQQVVKRVTEFFNLLSKSDVARVVQKVFGDFRDVFQAIIGDDSSSAAAQQRLVKTFEKIGQFAEKFYDIGKEIMTRVFTQKNIDMALSIFEFVVDNAGMILAFWAGLKVAMSAIVAIDIVSGLVAIAPALMSAAGAMAPWVLAIGAAVAAYKLLNYAMEDFLERNEKVMEMQAQKKVLENLGKSSIEEVDKKYAEARARAQMTKPSQVAVPATVARPEKATGTVTNEVQKSPSTANYAQKKMPDTGTSKDVIFVAGDINMDAQKVGEVLLRHGAQR